MKDENAKGEKEKGWFEIRRQSFDLSTLLSEG